MYCTKIMLKRLVYKIKNANPVLLTLVIFFITYCLLYFALYFRPPYVSVIFYRIIYFIVTSYLLILSVWEKKIKKSLYVGKIAGMIIVFVIIFSVLLVSMISQLYLKENRYVHDSVVQTEAAIEYLLAGKNFYQEDYTESPLIVWNEGNIPSYEGEITNPALYHYVYLPGYVLINTPFYLFFNQLVGHFDQRTIIALTVFGLVYLTYKLLKPRSYYLLFFIMFFLNPWHIYHWVIGVNDVVLLFFIACSLLMLRKNKYVAATILLAISCAIKQTAWFLLPFYLVYIYYKKGKNKKFFFKQCLILVLFASIIILPFFFWGMNAFTDDIFKYLSGSSETSYPIAGYGLGKVLLMLGVVNSSQYFPFWIFQLVIGLPVLIILILKQRRDNTLSTMILSYALFLLVFGFVSRYFNHSHFIYVAQLVLIGAFLYLDRQRDKKVTQENIKTTSYENI